MNQFGIRAGEIANQAKQAISCKMHGLANSPCKKQNRADVGMR